MCKQRITANMEESISTSTLKERKFDNAVLKMEMLSWILSDCNRPPAETWIKVNNLSECQLLHFI